MNNMNPWEKQLQSWTPRRPSAKISERLFASPRAAASDAGHRDEAKAGHPKSFFGIPAWLPVAASTCAVMLISVLCLAPQARSPRLAASPNSNMLASMALSDCVTGTPCQQWNLWQVVTFDWTKAAPSLSITGSFGLGRTNL